MIHILHLEDDPVDSQLALDLLREAGINAQVERVHTPPAFEAALAQPQLNLILSDYSIPGMNALEALHLAHQQRPEVPFVFLSGTIGEELAIETLKQGATDYVLKEHVSRLAPTVQRALHEAEEQTRRQQGEAALAKTTARFNGIISSAMDAIISIDAQQRIVLFNPAAEKMFRLPANQARGKSIDQFMPARFRGAHAHHVEAFGRTGVSNRAMGRLGALSGLRANGEEFPIEASISQTEIGGEKLFTVILRDISQRKRAEEALQESERNFRMLADNIPQLAWMADEKGWVFWYNQRWFSYTGTVLEQMQGWGWKQVHHPEHVARVVEKFRRHVEAGQVWEDTFPLRGSDGQFRWFLSRAFPIRDEHGRVSRWFGTNTDITEQLEANQALERAKAQLKRHAQRLEESVAERTVELREANADLEAFCYSLSHDMRGPLRAILSFSEFVREDCGPQLGPTGNGYLQKISSAARRLDRLIQDVLAFSRLSREPVELGPVDVEKLARDIIQERPELQPPAAEIAIEGPLPVLCGHEALLTQCVTNLLGNAVKFVRPGVVPRMRIWAEEVRSVPVRNEEESELQSQGTASHLPPPPSGNTLPGPAGSPPVARPSSRFVRLWFEDNGVGIEKEAQQKIFELFHRNQKTKDYEGTGIGLAIVRKAAERMGGQVGVESEVGKGSRFWLELHPA